MQGDDLYLFKPMSYKNNDLSIKNYMCTMKVIIITQRARMRSKG